MKRKTLFIILATLVLSLTSCAMSTDEIATYLTSINSSYQNGAYEQAQTEMEKLNKSTKNMTDEQKSKYDELKPLIEYATQKSGEINNALNDAQSLCDQKMYYEASQTLDKIATDYKLPPTEQKKFDEEKTTAENGIKSVKITDALKNVETIYNGGDYDKATEELSKIDTSNLTDAQSQKYQSLQTNIANAKAAAEKAAAEKAAAEAKAKAKIDISMARSKVIGTSGYPYASLLAENDEKWYFAPTDEPDANVRDSGGHVSKGVMVYSVDKNTGNIERTIKIYYLLY